MKFGKQLEISANPEWRDNYVQYKRLKRLIKRVAFEVEKKQNKQKKLQQKMEHHATGDVQVQVIVDETHPLLKAVVDEVQDAKDQFWEVLDANLKIVNDFYVGKVVTLTRSVGEFEVMLEDEKTPTGHVHTRSRTHSQADHGFAALQEIYDTLVDLRTFVQINHSGFRKIVKK
ncbi:Divalent anion:Na symporter (DASS) family protein, partial [Phytophthora palmivora]